MSINAVFQSVPAQLLERLRTDVQLLETIITRHSPSGPIDILSAIERLFRGILSDEEVDRMRNDPEAHARVRASLSESLAPDAEDGKALTLQQLEALGLQAPMDIGKAWHGLHFLLAGSPSEATPPPGNAVLGGTLLTDPSEYQPRLMDPEEVAATAAALDQLTDEELRGRYDPAVMASEHVSGGDWEDPNELDWLLSAFRQVRSYYRHAASRAEGLLLYLL